MVAPAVGGYEADSTTFGLSAVLSALDVEEESDDLTARSGASAVNQGGCSWSFTPVCSPVTEHLKGRYWR